MTQPVALVIEDDDTLATIFAQALQMAGYTTQVIGDDETALQVLATVTPDLIVLDMHLPGISGKQVLPAIQDSGNLQRARLIIATADSGLAATLQQQADLVLVKPVSFHQLRQFAARLRPRLD
ncbi:MAG: hypothetical protein Fur0021_01320 [Candidatus Promineifilaceae bacterium]